MLRIMCRSGYKPCVDQARSYYNDWLNNGKELPSNFKTLIFNTVIEEGDENAWNTLYSIALNETNSAEKLRYLRALAKSKDLITLKLY